MLVSMTGYGFGTATLSGVTASVELRSLNTRFYECSARLPRSLQQRENEIKDLIRTRVNRGKISVNVSLEREGSDASPVHLNAERARQYFDLVNALRASLGIQSELGIEALLRLPDVLTTEEAEDSLEDVEWNATKEALSAALTVMIDMRANEGAEIAKDLSSRIRTMIAAVDGIEETSKNSVQLQRERLTDRIQTLLGSEKADPERLELEIVVFADKVDITEEIVRFRSHVSYFLDMLASPESEGRKLSFLLQEMNREANTISSKSYDIGISHAVVGIKEELERIREQIQNIE